jgi:hypothetical protein
VGSEQLELRDPADGLAALELRISKAIAERDAFAQRIRRWRPATA